MIVRFPDRERERDPSWQAETQVQPDPMLQDQRRASPAVIGVAAVLGLAIVVMVFYGLTRPTGLMDAASTGASSATAGMTTSGQAPATGANAPSPADKANSAAHGTSSGQSGQAQPANQGQGIPAGKSGENR